jgi:hypothetical protein
MILSISLLPSSYLLTQIHIKLIFECCYFLDKEWQRVLPQPAWALKTPSFPVKSWQLLRNQPCCGKFVHQKIAPRVESPYNIMKSEKKL